MKFKIWSKKAAENANDKQLFFRLIKSELDDDILLVIADKSGNRIENGYIMAYDNDNHYFILKSGVTNATPMLVDHIVRTPCLKKDYELHAINDFRRSRLGEISLFADLIKKMSGKKEE